MHLPLLPLFSCAQASLLPYAISLVTPLVGASSMEKWGREGEMRERGRKTRPPVATSLLLVATSSSPIVGFVPGNRTHRVSGNPSSFYVSWQPETTRYRENARNRSAPQI
ncbi:hypothetical protein ACLOJK_037945 [Asimina triloba]